MTADQRTPGSSDFETPLQPGAYWLMENALGVLRVRVDVVPARIGSAPDCALTITDSDVLPLHAVIDRVGDSSDGVGGFTIAPSPNAPLWHNGRPLTAPEPLTHGDRVQLGGTLLRFVEVAAENHASHKTYIVVRRADGFSMHCVVQHTIVVVGRTHGDLLVMDDSIAGRHFSIESYAPDAVYVNNPRDRAPLMLGGQPVVGRRRIANGTVLSAGQTHFAVYGRPRSAMGRSAQRPPLAPPESASSSRGLHDQATLLIHKDQIPQPPQPPRSPGLNEAVTQETSVADLLSADAHPPEDIEPASPFLHDGPAPHDSPASLDPPPEGSAPYRPEAPPDTPAGHTQTMPARRRDDRYLPGRDEE